MGLIGLRSLCRALAGIGALAVVGAVGGTAPAAAHPFGDPQTVAIALDQARDEVVRVRWKVGGLDDLTLLGVALGVLPQDRVMLDGAAFFEPSDATAIGPSAKFSDYLLKQITVTNAGQDCTGTVEPPTELAKTGVSIDYTCAGQVGTAKVTVKTLTDLNGAYRTLATGPAGERAIYTSEQDTHDWLLGSAVATAQTHGGRSAAVQLSAVVGGVVLAAVVVLLVAVRRRRVAA